MVYSKMKTWVALALGVVLVLGVTPGWASTIGEPTERKSGMDEEENAVVRGEGAVGGPAGEGAAVGVGLEDAPFDGDDSSALAILSKAGAREDFQAGDDALPAVGDSDDDDSAGSSADNGGAAGAVASATPTADSGGAAGAVAGDTEGGAGDSRGEEGVKGSEGTPAANADSADSGAGGKRDAEYWRRVSEVDLENQRLKAELKSRPTPEQIKAAPSRYGVTFDHVLEEVAGDFSTDDSGTPQRGGQSAAVPPPETMSAEEKAEWQRLQDVANKYEEQEQRRAREEREDEERKRREVIYAEEAKEVEALIGDREACSLKKDKVIPQAIGVAATLVREAGIPFTRANLTAAYHSALDTIEEVEVERRAREIEESRGLRSLSRYFEGAAPAQNAQGQDAAASAPVVGSAEVDPAAPRMRTEEEVDEECLGILASASR